MNIMDLDQEVEVPSERPKQITEAEAQQKIDAMKQARQESAEKTKQGFFSIFPLLYSAIKRFIKSNKMRDISKALNPQLQQQEENVKKIEEPPVLMDSYKK